MPYKLWARINGKDYPVSFGSIVSDNLSETLDSATTVIPIKSPIQDLPIKPDDHVIIHSTETWTGSDGLDSDGITVRHEGDECVWCPNNHWFQRIYHERSEIYFKSKTSTPADSSQASQAAYLYAIGDYNGLAALLNVDISDAYDPSTLTVSSAPPETSSSWRVYSFVYSSYDPSHSDVYRHMLCDSIESKQLNFDDYEEIHLSLFSETKGMELCHMPNRTITQPTVDDIASVAEGETIPEAKTIWYWINSYFNAYSNWVKILKDGTQDQWEYVREFRLADASDGPEFDLKAKFDSTACPEMTLTAPTLREALSHLMNVLDCIPVVKDGVITYLDLSARKSSFADRRRGMRDYIKQNPTRFGGCSTDALIAEKMPSFAEYYLPDGQTLERDQIPNQSWKRWLMSGEEYSDRLRTDYVGAISKNNVTHCVEKLGFRNFGVSSMGFNDLRIETAHPIYKIKKIYIEWYKKVGGGTNRAFLAKYDITKLVRLQSERQVLSHDYTNFQNNTLAFLAKDTNDLSEFAKYHFFTVGYDIGSKFITGWGETLNFSRDGILNSSHSVLENIMLICEIIGYYGDWGSEGMDYFDDQNSQPVTIAGGNSSGNAATIDWGNSASEGQAREAVFGNMITKAKEAKKTNNFFMDIIEALSDVGKSLLGSPLLTEYTQEMKSVFFEIEYEGMIDGAVITSKDYHDGRVVRKDSQSSPLPIIETAGMFEKEKINKLGNKTVIVSQRVSDSKFLMQIGDYDKDDMIVYRRTLRFDRDYITATYYLCKDFVLKNYYTSVSARIRPFKFSSYGESVQRNENHYEAALISPSSKFYQKYSKNFSQGFSPSDAVSFLIGNASDHYPYHSSVDYIFLMRSRNTGLISYLLERQAFISGKSVCLKFLMLDSVSAGTYIENWNPDVTAYIDQKYGINSNWVTNMNDIDKSVILGDKDFLNDLSGAVQNWHMIQKGISPVDIRFSEEYVTATEKKDEFGDYNKDMVATQDFMDVLDGEGRSVYQKIMNLPLNPFESVSKIAISDSDKDQKEKINSIAQLELIGRIDEGVYISDWAAILSEANGGKMKSWTSIDVSIPLFWLGKANFTVMASTSRIGSGVYTVLVNLYDDPNAQFIFPTIAGIVSASRQAAEYLKSKTVNVNLSFTWQYPSMVYRVTVKSATFDANGSFESILCDIYEDESLISENQTVLMETGTAKVGDALTLRGYDIIVSGQGGEGVLAPGGIYTLDTGIMSLEMPSFMSNYARPKKAMYLWPSGYASSKFAVELDWIQNSDPQLKFLCSMAKLLNATVGMTATQIADCPINVADQNPVQDNSKLDNYYLNRGYIYFAPPITKIANSVVERNLFLYYSDERMTPKIMEEDAIKYPPEGTLLNGSITINGINVATGGYSEKPNGTITSAIADSINATGDVTIAESGVSLVGLPTNGSLRLYYLDSEGDGLYHLVWGTNDFEIEGDSISASFHVSILDDRSKTVLDEHGEGKYEAIDYANDEVGYQWGTENYCKSK